MNRNDKRFGESSMLIIDRLYSRYFQKSRGFIYPLLDLSRHLAFQPHQVYIEWSPMDISVRDHKLIAVFAYEDDEPGWQLYMNELLLKHPYLADMYLLDDAKLAFVFDLSEYGSDIDLFWEGKYSKLSPFCKIMVRNFYGIGTPEWAYMESFLEPEKHFVTYAALIEVEEAVLRATGELCDPPNHIKETLLTTVSYMTPLKRKLRL
ncbi:hypothetical protein [Spirosoma litoris]